MVTLPESWIHDRDLVLAQESLLPVLAALPGMVVVLDAQRRIVWASPQFRGPLVTSSFLGRRPGEALGCVHSAAGCGASPECYLCSTVDAVLESKRLDEMAVRRGVLETGDGVVDLEATATPWALGGRWFTILSLVPRPSA